MTKVNNLPFKELFELYGLELPTRSVFFTHKDQHSVSYRMLQKFYRRNTIFSAWKEFARDYALYAAEFSKEIEPEVVKPEELTLAEKIALAKANVASKEV